MNKIYSYYYHDEEVVGWFLTDEMTIKFFTRQGIYNIEEVEKEDQSLVKNGFHKYSKRELRNFFKGLYGEDWKILWNSVVDEFFSITKQELSKGKCKEILDKYNQIEVKPAEVYIIPTEEDKPVKVAFEGEVIYDSREDSNYYWPLGEIELEEVKF